MTQLELERNMAAAEPVATLTQVFLQSKGVKEVGDMNPFKTALKAQEATELIPAKVAKRFLDLSSRFKVPGWVLMVLDDDVEKIKLAGG